MFRRTKAFHDLQNNEALAEYNVEMLAKDYMANRNGSYEDTFLSKGVLARDVQVLLLSFLLGRDMAPESEAIEQARLAESVRTSSPFKA